MIKYSFKIFFLLIAAIIFYSCSKSEDVIVSPEDNSTNFKYPYSLNSNWFFTTTPNYTFHPDSLQNYVPSLDSIVETGFAIWKNDTIVNGINARVLRTNHTSTAHSYNTIECYVQTDSGLVNLSFDSKGVSFGPFRPNPEVTFPYKGVTYSSLEELRYKIFNELFTDNNSELNNFNCLKYPIVTNTEWFFRYTNLSPVQLQRKKYLDYEQVQTPAGTFNCIKVQRKNYFGTPEVLDTNYLSFDYFSKVGMVKRTYQIKNLPFIYKGNVIGYYDVGGEVILNSVNIIP